MKCENCGTGKRVVHYQGKFLCEACRAELIHNKLKLRKKMGLGNDMGFNSVFR